MILAPDLPKKVLSLCSNQSADEFLGSLRANSVAVKEDGNWAYLLPVGPGAVYTLFGSPELRWERPQVEVSIANADPRDLQTEIELKSEALSKLKDQVLEQARLVPVGEWSTRSQNEIGLIAFTFLVYVRHTRKGGPASLVLLMKGTDYWDGRIVYGEQQADGSFLLLWDSPIVEASNPTISFTDVDGDGVEEIVLHSLHPALKGGRWGRHLEAISVFDVHGNELTRQLHCRVLDFFVDYATPDYACPIVAKAVDIDYSHGPPYDIHAGATFTLRENHYVNLSKIRVKNPSPRK